MKSLEDTERGLKVLFPDSNAVVAHVQHRGCAGVLLEPEFDPFVGLVIVFHGVRNQIAKDFGDSHAIALKRGQRPGYAHGDGLLLQSDLQRIEDLGNQCV